MSWWDTNEQDLVSSQEDIMTQLKDTSKRKTMIAFAINFALCQGRYNGKKSENLHFNVHMDELNSISFTIQRANLSQPETSKNISFDWLTIWIFFFFSVFIFYSSVMSIFISKFQKSKKSYIYDASVKLSKSTNVNLTNSYVEIYPHPMVLGLFNLDE